MMKSIDEKLKNLLAERETIINEMEELCLKALKQIDDKDYVILLDLHGKMTDSLSFARHLDNLFITNSKITFVIGGSLGLSDNLLKRANERLKLSDMTFLHSITRLLLIEQIYRSFKILNNETYHK